MKYQGKYSLNYLKVLALRVAIVRKKIEGAKIPNIITPRHKIKNIKAPETKETNLYIDFFGSLIKI